MPIILHTDDEHTTHLSDTHFGIEPADNMNLRAWIALFKLCTKDTGEAPRPGITEVLNVLKMLDGSAITTSLKLS